MGASVGVFLWKIAEDDSLWVRTLSLSVAAQWGLESRFPGQGAKLGFGLENVSDPAVVFGSSHNSSPSASFWPEWCADLAQDGACVPALRVLTGQSGPWVLDRRLQSLSGQSSLKEGRISKCSVVPRSCAGWACPIPQGLLCLCCGQSQAGSPLPSGCE